MENQTSTIMQMVPLLFIQIPFVIAAVWLPPKMGARRWLWVILTIIPGLGLFAGWFLVLRVAGAILDKLNVLLEKR